APTLPVWVPEMVEVPAGPFLMGSSDCDKDAQSDEKPQHTLNLLRYEIGKTPVTNFQFRPFVEGDGYTNRAYWDDAGWQWRKHTKRIQPGYLRDSKWNGDLQPVVGVTWYEALAYTRWLSAQTGMTFQLPTEAMWEKAARGTDGRIYPWGNTWESGRANSYEAGIDKTTPVGQYPSGASPYGALDMAGNVWEWTASIYRRYPYNLTDGRENPNDPAQKRFTLRGGAWNLASLNLRTAFRFNISPAYGSRDIGVRLVQLLPSQTQSVSPPQTPVACVPQPQAKLVLPVGVPEMVEVPAGPFLMGSSDSDKDAESYEKPQHTLTLPSYAIGKTPVTNFQFRPFVEGDGYTNRAYWDDTGWQWCEQVRRTQPDYWHNATWNGDLQPVVCVSWFEAVAYCRWLSKQTGIIFQLPTEAMWEKAARGSDGRIYPWGNTWDVGRANSSEAGIEKTTLVGQYPSGASPYGALNMAGNVWEWTVSRYEPYPYNPTDGRENSSYSAYARFTLRGGSWNVISHFLRAARRNNLAPADNYLVVGFRLARWLPSA
ncbi:MAG: formylglycine-generating enzyme family protein, partial [Chloroflexales bacterium]